MWNFMEIAKIASRTTPDIEKGQFFEKKKTDPNKKLEISTIFQKIIPNSIPRNQKI